MVAASEIPAVILKTALAAKKAAASIQRLRFFRSIHILQRGSLLLPLDRLAAALHRGGLAAIPIPHYRF
jgi:hypothetical protein